MLVWHGGNNAKLLRRLSPLHAAKTADFFWSLAWLLGQPAAPCDARASPRLGPLGPKPLGRLVARDSERIAAELALGFGRDQTGVRCTPPRDLGRSRLTPLLDVAAPL